MRLTSISVRAFMAFGAQPQEVALEDGGLICVEGHNADDPRADSNGAGKSAIVEALCWGLYGRTVRRMRADQVVNRAVGRDCEVRLALRGPLGQKIEIDRYRARDGRHSGMAWTLEGLEQTRQGDPTGTQGDLEAALGMSWDAWTATAVFGQGQAARFAGATDAERRAILDKLLGISAIAQARDWVAKERTAARLTLSHAQAAMDVAVAAVERTEAAEAGAKEAWRRAKSQRVQRAADRIQELKQELAELAPPKLEAADGDPRKFEAAWAEAQRTCDSVRGQEREAEDRVRTLQARLDAHKETTRKRQSLDGIEACPLCGGSVDFEMLQQFALNAAETSRTLSQEMLTAKRTLAEIRKHLVAAEEAEALAEQVYRSAQSHAAKVATSKAVYETSQKRLRDEYKRTLHDLQAAKSEKYHSTDYQSLLEKLTAERDAAVSAMHEAEKRCKHLDFWAVGFSSAGIQSHLLDHVLPTLNERAAKYGRFLLDGIRIRFDSTRTTKSGGIRDKFDLIVESDTAGESYDALSGGEKRKVDIVVARVLQSIEADRAGGAACNVAIWDEVFESLDASSAEAVMSLLRDEAQARTTTFVITHQEWLRPYFPRVLRVTKRAGEAVLSWAA